MRRILLRCTVLGAILLAARPAVAVDAPSGPWLGGLDFPTNMAFAPDGRLFFTEKETGNVRIVTADGRLLSAPFLTLAVRGGGETGLLGIALDPRFDRGEPWVTLTRSNPDTGMNEVLRVRADGDRAGGDPVLLRTTVPDTNAYHNGGELLFGPDGMLYVTVGEAHQAERAQDPSDPGGKVLRLRPDGTPAPGGPFGPDDPVYTLGHRNSFGLCADPATGTIWETENGPDRDDEINRLVAGANYGWPIVTGDSGGRFEDPVSVFATTVAVTGCAVWHGELYVGSYKDGLVRRIAPDGSRTDVAELGAGVTDLQVGPDGRLYVATSEAIWALGDAASTMTRSPTPAPSDPAVRTRNGWIAVVAGAVLAVALGVRLWAGRRRDPVG